MRTDKELEELRRAEEYIKSIRDKGRQQITFKSSRLTEPQRSLFLTGFMAGYIEREKELRQQSKINN